MEEIRKLGDLALKLEKYRYNLTRSLGWVIFGMLFGSAVAFFSGITILIGYRWYVVASCLILAGVVGTIVHWMFLRFVPLSEVVNKRWKIGWFLFFVPFIILYTIPSFLNLTKLQASLYYSLAWYPSLGIGFLLVGIFAELKDKTLVTRPLTYAGILITVSSIVLVLMSGFVTDYYGVLALGLIATSMMLLIYLGAFLLAFFRSSKAVFET